jgi:hypothetical protein
MFIDFIGNPFRGDAKKIAKNAKMKRILFI